MSKNLSAMIMFPKTFVRDELEYWDGSSYTYEGEVATANLNTCFAFQIELYPDLPKALN